MATADTATASSTAGSTADVQASGGVVGALKAVHILQPWLGAVCVIVAAVVIAWLWWRRTRYLPWHRQLVVPAVAAVSAVASWLAVDVIWHPVADGVGWFVWTWVGVIGLVIAQLVTGNRTEGRHRAVRSRNRRLVRATESASSLVTVVASSLLAINTFFASYPTLASVLGYGVATTPLNRLQGAAARSPAPSRPATSPERRASHREGPSSTCRRPTWAHSARPCRSSSCSPGSREARRTGSSWGT